jgi:hypothetical protein
MLPVKLHPKQDLPYVQNHSLLEKCSLDMAMPVSQLVSPGLLLMISQGEDGGNGSFVWR